MISKEILANMQSAVGAARLENLQKLGFNAYQDNRCKESDHFILEKPDGSEVVVIYDSLTNAFTEIRQIGIVNV